MRKASFNSIEWILAYRTSLSPTLNLRMPFNSIEWIRSQVQRTYPWTQRTSLSIPLNGFETVSSVPPYKLHILNFQFHWMDSKLALKLGVDIPVKLSIPLNGFKRGWERRRSTMLQAFNSIEWIPRRYSGTAFTPTTRWLSIPLNGFLSSLLIGCSRFSTRSFNSIEWIHRFNATIYGGDIYNSFQFHWMDSHKFMGLLYDCQTFKLLSIPLNGFVREVGGEWGLVKDLSIPLNGFENNQKQREF